LSTDCCSERQLRTSGPFVRAVVDTFLGWVAVAFVFAEGVVLHALYVGHAPKGTINVVVIALVAGAMALAYPLYSRGQGSPFALPRPQRYFAMLIGLTAFWAAVFAVYGLLRLLG
jgi:hypothetical protein